MKNCILSLLALPTLLLSASAPVMAQNTNFYLADTLTNPATAGNSYLVAAADVNGDGRPDILVAGTNQVTIFTNNGSGGFNISGAVHLAANSCVAIAIGNIRGSDMMDLITADNSSDDDILTVYTNNGAGVFGSNAVYTVAGQAYGGINVVDVNGDGSPDLVISTYNITEFAPNCLSVLTNNGSGGFATSWTGTGYYYCHSAGVADLNGDGKPDIAITSYTYDEVITFTNAGGGQFGQSQVVHVGGSSLNCVAADFTGKPGYAGVAVSDSLDNGGIIVLTNNGAGQLAVQTSYAIGQNVGNLLAADFTGSGIPDIIGGSLSSNSLVMLANNGAGGFSQEPSLSSGPTEASPNGGAFAVANFNGGNTPGIAVVAPGSPIVSVYFGVGNPALSAAAPSNSIAYTWTTFAGLSTSGSADGVGSSAQFDSPEGLVSDSSGNVFVLDSGNETIRKITPVGVVTTIAGLAGAPGNMDGIGSSARFNFSTNFPYNADPRNSYSVYNGIAIDTSGNLFVSDSGNNSVREITPMGTNWVVSTLNIPPGIGAPSGITVDNSGNLYVADNSYTFTDIRKITSTVSDGQTNWFASTIITTYGNLSFGDVGFSGIAVDNSGNVYANYEGYEIVEIGPSGGQQTLASLAGGYSWPTAYSYGIALDSTGNVYVASTLGNTILKVTVEISGGQTNWVVNTFAGSGVAGSANGAGTNAQFNMPECVTVSAAGTFYVTDAGNNLIRKISSAGSVGLLAGALGVGSADGSGSSAHFNHPIGLAADNAGNFYVADTGNNTIRMITPAGVVNTLAGLAGSAGVADGVGSNARFNTPEGVAVDIYGNVFVADTGNDTVREITPAGVVSTIAGNPASGFRDGIGTNALFFDPCSIALWGETNLYVLDEGNHAIRTLAFNGAQWMVSTIVSNNIFEVAGGSYGIGFGPGLDFDSGTGLASDDEGDIYFLDTSPDNYDTPNDANLGFLEVLPSGDVTTNTRAVNLSRTEQNTVPSVPSTVRGQYGPFYHPAGVASDIFGNAYVADCYNNEIFEISSNGVVSVIGGANEISGSANGAGNDARFDVPSGIVLDGAGDIYVADTYNNTIRKGVFTAYGAANPVGYSPPALTNSLTVWLQPSAAGGQWRFPWEFGWHNSGDTESNLVAGNYPVQFSTVPGWLAVPASLTIADGDTLTVAGPTGYTNQYYPTIGTVQSDNGGTLKVDLGPNPPTGAAWGFLGEGTPSFPSDYTTNLPDGTYLIAFASVSGRVTPPKLAVQVQAGQLSYISENYLLSQPAPSGVQLPFPVPASEISDETNYPFAFDGQLETDVGYGSGVAVLANVVLTAAHLVFNDQTVSYVSQAYWYTQEPMTNASPGYPSEPMAARGWYMLSGYASQRTNDMEVYAPDTYTPQAANMDVAALYFLSPVAGGGYAGYLPSDASPNTWLTSTALKMLVGFPVDASQFDVTNVVSGQMYQTDPQPYPLALSTDPVADQQVYTATWFQGYPGNSGGPLYVQLNGYYYPAAVYLAALYNGTTPYASAVRAIDSEVVSLITNAAASGDSGTNHTGGGVITVIPDQNINVNNQAYLEVQLSPPAAVSAGAAWKLTGLSGLNLASLSYFTNYLSTNWMIAVSATNEFSVNFKPVQGWIQPADEGVALIPNVAVTNFGYYTVVPPTMSVSSANGIGITGTAGTAYIIQYRTNLLNGQWQPQSTNILGQGFNKLLSWPPTNRTSSFYRAVWIGR